MWQYPFVPAIPDSHRLFQHLSEGGFDEQQSEALIEALQEIDLSNVATKDDLERLELRMTLRLGGLITAGVAFLAFLKFFP